MFCCICYAVGAEPLQSDETIDPYDLLDPVDILSKLPADFYEKIVRF